MDGDPYRPGDRHAGCLILGFWLIASGIYYVIET